MAIKNQTGAENVEGIAHHKGLVALGRGNYRWQAEHKEDISDVGADNVANRDAG